MRVIWILAWVLGVAAMAVPGRAFGPDESHWSFDYPVPDEDVRSVTVTLSYRWWDPKVDGDLASKKVLLTSEVVKVAPGTKSVPIQVLINGGKSVVTIGKQVFKGRGYLLDPSFERLAPPKLNYNNFYVLAQKPSDPKNPAAPGDVQSAAAWIELGIDPHT